MVKWIREWTADPEIGVQVQVRVSEKKSLDKYMYGLSVRSAVEGGGHKGYPRGDRSVKKGWGRIGIMGEDEGRVGQVEQRRA